MEDELVILPIEPLPTPSDGSVEMHADGGGMTVYRMMTPVEGAAMMARYNIERDDA